MSEEIGSLKATFTLNAKPLTAGLKNAARQLSSFKKQHSPLQIDLGFNQKRFRGELSSVSRALSGLRRDFAKPVTATIGQRGAAETVRAATGVKKALDSLDGQNATVQIGEKGSAATVAGLGAVGKARSSLDGKNASVEVKERGAASTVGQLAVVDAAADRVDGRRVKLGFDASQLDILDRLNTGLGETASRIRSVQTVGATAAIPVFIAGIAGIVPVATAAGAALGGLASAAGQGLAGGLGAGLSAISGFSGGLGLLYAAAFPTIKAFSDMETNSNALSTAQNGLKTATDGVATAQKSLASAQQGVADAQQSAAERVTQAVESYHDSLRGIEDAEEGLASARNDLRDSTEAVFFAQRDFNDALEDEPLNQRDATLDLADARDRASDSLREYNEAVREHGRNSEEATDAQRDLARANLDLQQTERDVGRIRERTSDEFQSSADNYLQAREDQRDATGGVKSAEGDLRDAQKASGKAFGEIAKAQQQGAKEVAAAQRGVKDAQAEVAAALAKVATAQAEVTAKTKGLTASQSGLLGVWQKVSTQAGRIFKPANDDLNDLAASTLRYGSGALPSLGSAAQKTVGGLSGAIETLKGTLGSSQQLALFNRFLGAVPNLFEKGVVAAGSFGGGVANMLIAALPAANRMTDALAKMGERLRSWSAGTEGQSALTAFFDSAQKKGAVLLDVFRDLTLGVVGLSGAFDESGLSGRMLSGLADVAARFRAFTAAGSEGRAMLVSFSTAAQPTLDATWRLLGGIFTEWGNVAGALIRARDEAGKLIVPSALDGIRKALPVIGNLLISTFSRFGPMLGPLISGVAGLLTAFIAFNPVLQRLTGFVVGVLDAFNSLPRPMQTVLVSAASIASIMGAVGIGFSAISAVLLGGTIPAITTFGAWLAGTSTAAITFGGALGAIASAALPVVAVIGGLAAAGYLVYRNWNTLGPIFSAVGGVVGGLLKNAFTNFMDAARPAWNFIKALGGGLLQGAADGLGRIGGHISDIFGTERLQQGASKIKAALTPPDDSAWNTLKVKVAEFFGWLDTQSKTEGTGTNKIFVKLTDDAGAIDRAKIRWTGFTIWLKESTAGTKIPNVFSKLTDDKGAIDNVKTRWQQFKTWLSGALKIPGVQNIWTRLTDDQGAIDRAKTRFQQFKEWFRASAVFPGVKSIWTKLTDDKGAIENVKTRFGQLRTSVTQQANQTRTSLGTAWQGALASTQQKFGGIYNSVAMRMSQSKNRSVASTGQLLADVRQKWNSTEGTTSQKFGAVANLVQSKMMQSKNRSVSATGQLLSDVRSKWNQTEGTTKQKFSAVAGHVLSKMSQSKNSSVRNTGQLLADIRQKWTGTEGSTRQKFNAVAELVGSRMSTARDRAKDRAGELKERVMGVFNSLPSPIQKIFQKVRDYISDPIGTAVSNVKGFLSDLVGVVNKVLGAVGIKKIGVDFGGGGGNALPPDAGSPNRRGLARGGVTTDPNYGTAFARGGVAEKFARGGMGTEGRNPRTHLWNEQQGGEAFIAQRRPAKEQLPYLQTAADWHGYAVIPADPAKKRIRCNGGEYADGGVYPPPVVPFAIGGETSASGQAMHAAVKKKFGVDGFNLHSNYLPQPGASRSIDWMVTAGGSRAEGSQKTLGDNIASYVAPPSTRATIWYGQANFGAGWQGYSTGPGMGNSNTLGHYDHVHGEALAEGFRGAQGTAPTGAPGGGGGVNPMAAIFENRWNAWVKPLVDRVLGPLKESPNKMLNIVGAMAQKVPTGIKEWISGQLGSSDGGPVSGDFSGSQKQVALEFAKAAKGRGMPGRLPVMTALQESGMKNLDYGHGTSVGYFQLIDTHGSKEWRMNPANSLGWFLDGADDFKGQYENTPTGLGAWAQAVQRSAYPDAYAKQWNPAGDLIGDPKYYEKGGLIPGRAGVHKPIMAEAGEIVLPTGVSKHFVNFTSSLPNLTRSLREATKVRPPMHRGGVQSIIQRTAERQTGAGSRSIVQRMENIERQSGTNAGGETRSKAQAPSDPETKALLREVRDGINVLNERGIDINDMKRPAAGKILASGEDGARRVMGGDEGGRILQSQTSRRTTIDGIKGIRAGR